MPYDNFSLSQYAGTQGHDKNYLKLCFSRNFHANPQLVAAIYSIKPNAYPNLSYNQRIIHTTSKVLHNQRCVLKLLYVCSDCTTVVL